MHICNFQCVHPNKRWLIKCAVSMHLHALKAECIISQCKYWHLTILSRISILNSMALTMKCRRRSQHPNRPPDTRWAHWVSSAGGSQKHPKSSHTNMELKILQISLLQNMLPQHSHINQINIHLSAFQTDFMQRFLRMAQGMALFVSWPLFSRAQWPLLIPLCRLRQFTNWNCIETYKKQILSVKTLTLLLSNFDGLLSRE